MSRDPGLYLNDILVAISKIQNWTQGMSLDDFESDELVREAVGLKLNKWKIEDHLRTEEDIGEYWAACLIEGGDDPAFLTKALGEIARIRGMTQLSRDTGISWEGLYKALSGEGNPEFATVLKVINALGLKLRAS